ncbi:MAG TPA: carboxymuconolactone decarboxylase [Acidimicrobiia bacterium]
MSGETPLLETVIDINAVSIENAAMEDSTLMLVRLAALTAVNAPPASYLLNLGAAAESGLTMEDARSVLIAVAPIVGTPRVVAAAGAIAEALGIAIALDEELQSSTA